MLPGEGLWGDGGEKVKSPQVARHNPASSATSSEGTGEFPAWTRQRWGCSREKQAAGSQSWPENKIIALCQQ